jgi:hypothetical protein
MEGDERQARVVACYGDAGCLAEGGGGMVLVVVGATLLLCMALGLFGGTMLVYLRRACAQPSRVEEIRHLRQAGLAVPRVEE